MKSARAVADVGSGTILASVEIGKPPERVFRALTTPEELTRWWGADGDYRTTSSVQDLRVGGAWRSEGLGQNGKFFVHGNFIEVDPPRKLVFTWLSSWTGEQETRVTYALEAIAGGTRLTVRHDGFTGRPDACRGHGAGWERVFGWLTRFLEGDRPPRWYLLRLVPPRPDFAMTLTAEERAIMGQHAEHLRSRLAEGELLIAGPVADPAGPWGLGVARATEESELLAFLDKDPAILSGRGFRYEVLPMLSAMVA